MTKLINTPIYLLMMVCYISIPLHVCSQEPQKKKHLVGIYGGYGYIGGEGIPGLTDNSKKYKDKLEDVPQWDIQYFYCLDKKRVAHIGFLYSGYTTQNSLPNGSDKILIQTFIPQFGFNLLQKKHFILRLDVGIGFLSFKNSSSVYQKPRKVTGSSSTSNIHLNLLFPINAHWGISVNAGRQMAHFISLYTSYNNERIDIDKWFSIRKGNISAGIIGFF